MKTFNAALLGHAFGRLTEYAEQIAASGLLDEPVQSQGLEDVSLTLTAVQVIAVVVQLPETNDAIRRLQMHMKSNVEPISNINLQYALQNILDLMKSELDKRKVFAIDPLKSHFYQDDIFGIKPPNLFRSALLPNPNDRPTETLFSLGAIAAFPSAYMDIVEAGRCLALNRNNAAIYHLMQVAEIGLRTVAWDRRVTVKFGKYQKTVPLDYAQWGQIIGELIKEKDKIDHWPRSKPLKEEAKRYYTRVIFEVDSFNEIFRKHISHARGELYESDTAVSCWGYIYRFMGMLAERMSETNRTPKVWNTVNYKA